MKIRTKISLRYTSVTAVLLLCFASLIYFTSAQNREQEFFHTLKKEGVSKANLFLEAEATPDVMHSIYRNNIAYIDEVEVAIYNMNQEIIYHDDVLIDIVKETPDLLNYIANSLDEIEFYEGDYQAVGFVFTHGRNQYLVTAAAYDGYGYAKQWKLAINLLVLSLCAILLLLIIGYFLAKRALKPVADITDEMRSVMGNKLFPQLITSNEKDEIGELATQFNHALTIIEDSYESQKQFISNVSHELRTPLATLVGEIDVALLKDRAESEYRQILMNARKDSDILIELTNDLLNLAKVSYDGSKIAMSEVRIDEMLLDARELVLKANSVYTIDLVFAQEIDDDSQITIVGNEYLLRTAFVNLMENNCKFSPDHTSRVLIAFVEGQISIHFEDNGIGISEEEMELIFQPFYRGANKDFSEGNGVGMTLVQRVIQLHGASLDIASQKGHGTVFHIVMGGKTAH